MENKIAAKFNNDNLKYLDEKLCPLSLLKRVTNIHTDKDEEIALYMLMEHV